VCTGKLSNGKDSSCVFWQKNDSEKPSVEFVCALPQVLMEATPDASQAGVLTVRLMTNAVSSLDALTPYTFSIDCDARDLSVSPAVVPSVSEEAEESSSVVSRQEERPFTDLVCTYPDFGESKTYTVKGWASVQAPDKTIVLDPVYNRVVVGAHQTSLEVLP
jgi:hypothetical protein